MKTFVLLRCLMKILEPNQYQKSDNAPSIICADFEYLIKTKWINVKIILKNHLQQKQVNIPSGFSKSTISLFKGIKNKNDVCRGQYCLKHKRRVINFKKKK